MSENTSEYPFDILIAGAGFAGSLAALMLHQSGFKVCLVEKAKHPRFAIGESSTPIADMILRDLAKQYDLPWLSDFSRYGSWQHTHPEIVCGLKRGFSYFKHFQGKEFSTDDHHKNELLVAASVDDSQSDTNWLRADLDAFLVGKVREYGITYLDLIEMESAQKSNSWCFQAVGQGRMFTIRASFFIDATGGGGLLENLLGIKSTTEGFQTNSYSLFSHFENVAGWTNYLKKAGISVKDYPYDPDHSALHQVLDEGWMWMLRFNDDRLSMGLVLDGTCDHSPGKPAVEIWNEFLKKYPSLKKLVKNASFANEPGRFIRTGRLQRRLTQCFGEGWVALPHTAGFVDPLHSTGIAHTLSGLEKIVKILSEHRENTDLVNAKLKLYEQSVFKELQFIDLLVAGCYKTFSQFELFKTWSMLYFTAAIACEQKRLKGDIPVHFLEADDKNILGIVQKSYGELVAILAKDKISSEEINEFVHSIRKRIKPYNIAGLMDPSAKNMYRHTAVAI